MNQRSSVAIVIVIFTMALFAFGQSSGATEKTVSLTGINIAGADFGGNKLPGIFN
jgi:hypothetical protein